VEPFSPKLLPPGKAKTSKTIAIRRRAEVPVRLIAYRPWSNEIFFISKAAANLTVYYQNSPGDGQSVST
jgi:hypothetical protein